MIIRSTLYYGDDAGAAIYHLPENANPLSVYDILLNMLIALPLHAKIVSLLFYNWKLYWIPCIYIVIYFILKTILKSVMLYILIFMQFALLIAIAPIFIIMMLFKTTFELFDAWMKQIIATALLYILLSTSIVIFMKLIVNQITNLLFYRVCWQTIWTLKILWLKIIELKFWYPQSNTETLDAINAANFIAFLIVGIVCYNFLDQIPSLVDMLVGSARMPTAALSHGMNNALQNTGIPGALDKLLLKARSRFGIGNFLDTGLGRKVFDVAEKTQRLGINASNALSTGERGRSTQDISARRWGDSAKEIVESKKTSIGKLKKDINNLKDDIANKALVAQTAEAMISPANTQELLEIDRFKGKINDAMEVLNEKGDVIGVLDENGKVKSGDVTEIADRLNISNEELEKGLIKNSNEAAHKLEEDSKLNKEIDELNIKSSESRGEEVQERQITTEEVTNNNQQGGIQDITQERQSAAEDNDMQISAQNIASEIQSNDIQEQLERAEGPEGAFEKRQSIDSDATREDKIRAIKDEILGNPRVEERDSIESYDDRAQKEDAAQDQIETEDQHLKDVKQDSTQKILEDAKEIQEKREEIEALAEKIDEARSTNDDVNNSSAGDLKRDSIEDDLMQKTQQSSYNADTADTADTAQQSDSIEKESIQEENLQEIKKNDKVSTSDQLQEAREHREELKKTEEFAQKIQDAKQGNEDGNSSNNSGGTEGRNSIK